MRPEMTAGMVLPKSRGSQESRKFHHTLQYTSLRIRKQYRIAIAWKLLMDQVISNNCFHDVLAELLGRPLWCPKRPVRLKIDHIPHALETCRSNPAHIFVFLSEVPRIDVPMIHSMVISDMRSHIEWNEY